MGGEPDRTAMKNIDHVRPSLCHVLNQFQADCPLGSDHLHVIKGMHIGQAARLLESAGEDTGGVERRTVEEHLGAKPACGHHFRERRALGHGNGGGDAKQTGCQGDPLRMVAGRVSYDALHALRWGQTADFIVRPHGP